MDNNKNYDENNKINQTSNDGKLPNETEWIQVGNSTTLETSIKKLNECEISKRKNQYTVLSDNVAEIEEENTSSTQQKETKEEERLKENCGKRKQGDERKGLIKKKTYDVNEMDLNKVQEFLQENLEEVSVMKDDASIE